MLDGNSDDLQAAPSSEGWGWKVRAIAATKGNQTFTGMVLIAILGKATSNPPRITSGAVITKDGRVQAAYQRRGEAHAAIRTLCTIDELIARFRYLSDHLKLSDKDNADMFKELRLWINHDDRVGPSNLESHL